MVRQKSSVCISLFRRKGFFKRRETHPFSPTFADQHSSMADETPKSEVVIPNLEEAKASVDATIESNTLGGTESSCNNGETSAAASNPQVLKSLEYADELMEKGSKAEKERDYTEATDCYSRALEIRTFYFGELASECVDAYYKYGCALLYKAQDEADVLGAMPKKEDKSQEDSDKDGSVKSVKSAESSAASISVKAEENGCSNNHDEVENNDDGGKDGADDDSESDAEDLAEADEDESDLDLAWKMLDIARAIVEKNSVDTMEKVDILSALAEVALEREDIESSISDYLKALSILERLVEPDSRHIASLNFRICLCLEIGSKPQDAVPYCEKAISVCKSRMQRLMNEGKSSLASIAPESCQSVQLSSSTNIDTCADKDAEIETLTGLLGDLERKLEDLQQLVTNPTAPILPDILAMIEAKAKGHEKGASSALMSSSRMGTASSGDLDSPTVSTAHTNGAAQVTHLGVVGRGVKRVLMNSDSTESSPMKKPALGSQADKGDGKAT